MTDEPTTTTSGATGDVDSSRRDLLRASAGAVAAGGLFGGAGAGLAGAQENDSGGNESGDQAGDEGTDTVLAQGAIPETTTTFGRDTYEGLFLQVESPTDTSDEPNASGCGFVDGDQPVATFLVHLITRIDGASRSNQAILYANADTTEITSGRLFVVNSTQSCGSGNSLVQLELESIGASRIDGVVDDQNEPGEDETNNPIPGFGPVTAVGGLAAAGAAALGMRGQDGDD
ncbi:hypothetical protein ACFO0N_08790 [Halobium salinum]|uniref:PGF-CTERM protein n=1 Tax=Halobium salinum TaxID=1364940 RepID=A0ABD5PC36_9EURY|nr:hypothetical protein [Halobium salinum]